jgi:transcriptional regulator with GAF, ATPase, and Fis domain
MFVSMMMSTPMPFPAEAAVVVASSDDILRRKVIESLHFTTGHVEEARGGAEALAKLETGKCRVLMLDRCLSDLTCEDVVKTVGAQHPSVEVILLDPESGTASLPVFGTRQQTPSLPASQTSLSSSQGIAGLIAGSTPMVSVINAIRRVAKRNTTVLLTGETGTGKEVVAQAIHRLSNRAGKPFVTVNCAAIPEALLESELFGYVRGAFTGAVQSRMGRIHTAHGGVLFLDEIGEMPVGLQAKLLRFLESGEVQRLGSPDIFRVDVRVIAATNANLPIRIAERQFREDLYYRLAVFPIELPPLRARGNDVLDLATHFLKEFCGDGIKFSPEAQRWLLAQPWRGNIRELRHCIERASVLWDGEGAITNWHLEPRP